MWTLWSCLLIHIKSRVQFARESYETYESSRVSPPYLATSDNQMLVHIDWAMQVPYAMERKADSTVSGDWKMKLKRQPPLALGAISITVRKIRYMAKKMYLRTSLPVPFLKQLSARFPHCWKDARPCCCTPGTCHCSCLKRWGVLWKLSGLLHQWSDSGFT